jgi:hypothetical protein
MHGHSGSSKEAAIALVAQIAVMANANEALRIGDVPQSLIYDADTSAFVFEEHVEHWWHFQGIWRNGFYVLSCGS